MFSVAKDKIVCAWWSANGERLGTYSGHLGAIWTVDVSPNTILLATGSADNSVRLWNVKTGECVKVWEFTTAVKRVEFSPDGSRVLAVTEKRMGYLGTIAVLDINYDGDFTNQAEEPSLRITCHESKATVAGWSYLGKYIVAGHEDGSVSQYDGKVRLSKFPRVSQYADFGQTGEQLENVQAHEFDHQINDLQFSLDRTHFLTASKDKSAKVRNAFSCARTHG